MVKLEFLSGLANHAAMSISRPHCEFHIVGNLLATRSAFPREAC